MQLVKKVLLSERGFSLALVALLSLIAKWHLSQAFPLKAITLIVVNALHRLTSNLLRFWF